MEGNHPFQVVWLPDDRRDVFLDEITRLSAQRPTTRRQIVFEGTRPAGMEQSETLAALFAAPAGGGFDGGENTGAPGGLPTSVHSGAAGLSGSAASTPRVWLGEPLAIQAATSAVFTRRGGSNLLLLGQNDEAAAGMFIGSVLSLAAQLPAANGNGEAGAAFTILNGGLPDREYMPLFAQLPRSLPSRVRLAQANDTASVMGELAAEIERRHSSMGDESPRFLFVFDLPRLRELRRQEDEFSFSRSAEESPRRPDQQFADILRDGAAVGVHVIVWCDSLTNFQRMLDRQGLKEFDTRVLLQMSPADSSLLMDTPAASLLGKHRALLHREDEGRLEKFRPYAPPDESWLARICEQLGRRAMPTTD